MSPQAKIFIAGVLCHASLEYLRQDFLGKEGYIRYVESNWVSSGIGVPLALIGLIFAIRMVANATWELKEN